MTHVQIKGSKFTITKEGSSSYESWFRSTLDYLIERLDLKSITLGGKDFNFLEALPLRFIKDNDLIELDRSLEIRIDSNNVLYLDCILGSLMLKQLSSANDFKKIANKLGKLHLVIDKDNPKVYIAETTIHGYTLPERASKKNTQTVIDATKNLPYEIFNGQISDYNLARITTKAMILKFSSKAIEESNDTEETETVVISSIDEDNTSEAYTTANNDVAEKEVEAVDPTERTETDLTSKTAPSTEVNNGRIEIISGSSSLSSPIKGSITIGNNSKKGDPKTHIALNPSSTEEVSTSKSDDGQSTEIALPTQTLSWSDWAYDNIYPIAATTICVIGGIVLYKYTTHTSPTYVSPTTNELGSPQSSVLTLSPQTDHTAVNFGDTSIQSPVGDGDIRDVMDGSPASSRFSIASIFSGQRTPEMPHTPGVNNLLQTVMKTANRIRGHETASEAQINTGVTYIIGHLSHPDNKWLTNYQKEFNTFLVNFMTDKVRSSKGDRIPDLLLENYRSDYTLEFKQFQSILKRTNWKESTKITKLGLDTLYTELNDATPEDLMKDIREADPNLQYLLYLAMMIAIPVVKAIEEENPEDYLNNNATEWHSLSMLTEADFDDEDSEDYVVNYNNTHPELVLKAFSQAIEDSYKNKNNFELNFISDTGIQCRSVLNNAIEILGDTLYLTAHITKASNPLVTLFNNFYAIPALYSNVDFICDSVEESIDNAYLTAEEFYDSALELLGIEDSSE